MLLPSAIGGGLVMAGFELGRISAGHPAGRSGAGHRVRRLQSTVLGLRGLVAPLITIGLLRLGVPHNAIFLLSVLCLVLGWLAFARVRAPMPGTRATANGRSCATAGPFGGGSRGYDGEVQGRLGKPAAHRWR